MGLLTRDDSTIYRGWFKEMAFLRGISVKYQYAIETTETIHSEFDSELSDPIPMDIIFDTNPRVNTLKLIGWVSENPDDKPYIAYLPYDAPNLTTESIITIPPQVDVTTMNDVISGNEQKGMADKSFKVTTINQLIEFPDCWICTLAPVYVTKEVDNDYSSTNFNFVKEKDDEDPNSGLGLGLGLGLI